MLGLGPPKSLPIEPSLRISGLLLSWLLRVHNSTTKTKEHLKYGMFTLTYAFVNLIVNGTSFWNTFFRSRIALFIIMSIFILIIILTQIKSSFFQCFYLIMYMRHTTITDCCLYLATWLWLVILLCLVWSNSYHQKF